MRLQAVVTICAGLGAVSLLAGCGAPDLSSGNRSSLDSSMSGGYGGGGVGQRGAQGGAPRTRGVYPMVEVSFDLPDGVTIPNPIGADVALQVTGTDGRTRRLPAFYDSGRSWRIRFAPENIGKYTFGKAMVNGREQTIEKLDKKEADASGTPDSGFVRRDSKEPRFVLDNGNVWFPVGVSIDEVPMLKQPVESKTPTGTVEPNAEAITVFEAWRKEGVNSVRLRVPTLKMLPLVEAKGAVGGVDGAILKQWDSIIAAAEKVGVRLQMVLYGHEELSTRENGKWSAHPWNKQNGGFLSAPDEFFVHPKAALMTRAQLQFLTARWGYSTHISAWELVDDVEKTDSLAHNHADEVAAWHNHMVEVLHKADVNNHLVTSSSSGEPFALGKSIDFQQVHSTSSSLLASSANEPWFVAEFQPKNPADWRDTLTRSLFSGAAGLPHSAVKWSDKLADGGAIQSVTDLMKRTGINIRTGIKIAEPVVDSADRGPTTLATDQKQLKSSEVTVLPSGSLSGGQIPSFLRGSADRKMAAKIVLHVDFPVAGTCEITVGRAAKAGASLDAQVDGSSVASLPLAPAESDRNVSDTSTLKIGAGPHVITLSNSGPDWLALTRVRLAPYGPSVSAIARSNSDFAAALLNRNGAGTSTAKLTLPHLSTGTYQVSWWDPTTGKSISEETANVDKGGFTVTVPAFDTTIGVWIVRGEGRSKTDKSPKPSVKKPK